MNKDLCIPNLGSASSVEVVTILAHCGQYVCVDDPLCVVESEKSSFDIVSLYEGEILSLSLFVGQKISTGESFGVISLKEISPENKSETSLNADTSEKNPSIQSPQSLKTPSVIASSPSKISSISILYASPLVRKLARESQTSLSQIQGTGQYGRISIQDLNQYVQSQTPYAFPPPESSSGSSLWGKISIEPMSSIKKIASTRFEQSWKNIPHVTHFDIAYINDLESQREKMNAENAHKPDYTKVTLLSMIIKALAKTLHDHPIFNSSLSSCGKKILFKESIHIGCAVETSKGLLVPVIKNPLELSIQDIAQNIKDLAMRARAFELKPEDYQGQTFTVSLKPGVSNSLS
jgi:pyruvate dehydrogenase E2 component (dihydrolipoamide acetyltransferase)